MVLVAHQRQDPSGQNTIPIRPVQQMLLNQIRPLDLINPAVQMTILAQVLNRPSVLTLPVVSKIPRSTKVLIAQATSPTATSTAESSRQRLKLRRLRKLTQVVQVRGHYQKRKVLQVNPPKGMMMMDPRKKATAQELERSMLSRAV
jgi:hypothetical protein